MKTIEFHLETAISFLQEKGIKNARSDAEDLLSSLLQISKLSLFFQKKHLLGEKEEVYFQNLIKERGELRPLVHILGEIEFFGAFFKVTNEVLIPRPETEILADQIAKFFLNLPDMSSFSLWDLCTGSGCLGISLKKKFPSLSVSLSDLSSSAIEITKENAKKNDVDVSILQGDLFLPFEGKKTYFMVCNPPYLSEEEYDRLDKEVKDFEPKIALLGGIKGLEFYERIRNELETYLLPGGILWLEIGYLQGRAIFELFSSPSFLVEITKDFAGHDRFASIKRL